MILKAFSWNIMIQEASNFHNFDWSSFETEQAVKLRLNKECSTREDRVKLENFHFKFFPSTKRINFMNYFNF